MIHSRRLDQSVFGVKAITLNDYNTNSTYAITATGPGQWDCKRSDIQGAIWPPQVPPEAKFVENTTVSGQPVEHWNANYIIAQTDYYVKLADDPKQLSTVLKAKVDSFGFGFTYEFSNVVPKDFEGTDTFDAAQFGCPPPKPPVTYPVSGYVLDATTGGPIAGASVQIEGEDAVKTNSDGVYSYQSIAPGPHTLAVTGAAGYEPGSHDFNVTDPIVPGTSADVFLSPTLQPGTYRAVLAWAAQPRDMDAHLVMPSGSCTVIYNNRHCTGPGGLSATLDHDVTSGYGPETITITAPSGATGNVTFVAWVYSYYSGALASSASKVQLFSSGGHVHNFALPAPSAPNAPGASCHGWQTFQLDVATGEVTLPSDRYVQC